MGKHSSSDYRSNRRGRTQHTESMGTHVKDFGSKNRQKCHGSAEKHGKKIEGHGSQHHFVGKNKAQTFSNVCHDTDTLIRLEHSPGLNKDEADKGR